MPLMPLRTLTLPEPVASATEAWLAELDARLGEPGADWNAICRDTLFRLWYPAESDWAALVEDPALPLASRAALLALDPRHVTLEPEYYADVDPVKFARVKPLLWLWYSFDRSPLGGQQVDLGVREHSHQSTEALGAMAAQIMLAAWSRLERQGKIQALHRPGSQLTQFRRGEHGHETVVQDVSIAERPPMSTVRTPRQGRATGR